jgi:DNA-binding LacI/PurR family transcriptional regulator
MTGTLATQSDIARLSKVSRSTVAAILRSDSGDSAYAQETRRRVMEAARRLNYRPNSAARSLRSGRTHTIALAVANFGAIRGPIQIANLEGIGEQAQKLGYALTLSGYDEHTDLRVTFRRLLREGRFDGVVFYGSQGTTDDQREEIFAGLKIHFVGIEKISPRFSCIDFDNVYGAKEATRHLIRLGRRRIGFLGCNEQIMPSRLRRQGYQAACLEAGLELEPELVVLGNVDQGYADSGYQGIKQLLDAGISFDALFCASDDTALAAIQVLSERGLRVPDDVAVVGYDDNPLARLANPALTTVHQDGVEMGRQAMTMLHQLIEGDATSPIQQMLRPTLVVRRSCGAALSASTLRDQ